MQQGSLEARPGLWSRAQDLCLGCWAMSLGDKTCVQAVGAGGSAHRTCDKARRTQTSLRSPVCCPLHPLVKPSGSVGRPRGYTIACGELKMATPAHAPAPRRLARAARLGAAPASQGTPDCTDPPGGPPGGRPATSIGHARACAERVGCMRVGRGSHIPPTPSHTAHTKSGPDECGPPSLLPSSLFRLAPHFWPRLAAWAEACSVRCSHCVAKRLTQSRQLGAPDTAPTQLRPHSHCPTLSTQSWPHTARAHAFAAPQHRRRGQCILMQSLDNVDSPPRSRGPCPCSHCLNPAPSHAHTARNATSFSTTPRSAR
eukprot:365174-Chlamydomonas_euryale.AAC.2